MTGRIHSIQSVGTVDGAGVRTVVFMQGCPLRCGYCHNPDTWDTEGGEIVEAEELFQKIRRFAPYFGEEGGVTLSGGEVLLQPGFGTELFSLCKAKGLNTALDTSGCLWNEEIDSLLSVTDLVLLDIKMTTDADYREYVGCPLAKPLFFLQKLEEKGFNVTVYDEEEKDSAIGSMKIEEFKKKYDVILYFCNIETNGSDSAARITWPGHRATVPQMIHDVPTMMVSIDNPYHLIDAPRIPTYINAYTSEDIVVETLVEKIAGESTFKGVSPVDAFAGYFNANK